MTAPTAPAPAPAPWTPVTSATPILVDLFPAVVSITPSDPGAPPTAEAGRTRLIITADPETMRPAHAYVFIDSAGGPALLYSAAAAPPASPTPAPTQLRTSDGRVLTNRTGALQILSAERDPALTPDDYPFDDEEPPPFSDDDPDPDEFGPQPPGTEDTLTLLYAKDSGCGCGSALKSFAPFTHPYSVA